MFIQTKSGVQELPRNPDGSPTDEEMREWDRWSEHGRHLHNSKAPENCPCCEGNATYYLSDGWYICLDCILAFRREDALPVITKAEADMRDQIEAEGMQQIRLENYANKLEQLAYELEHMIDKEA